MEASESVSRDQCLIFYLPLIIQINNVFMMNEPRIYFLAVFEHDYSVMIILDSWNHVPIAICCKCYI